MTTMPTQETAVNRARANAEMLGSDQAMVDVSLGSIVQLLRERGRFLIIFVAVSACLGAVVSFMLPVWYQANTTIMSPQATQSSLQMIMNQPASSGASSLAMMSGGVFNLKSPNELYVGLLKSRPVADAIIHQFALMSLYHSRDMTDARALLNKYTSITDDKGGFIVIAFTARDQRLAANVANAYTEQLRILTRSLSASEAAQRRQFYEDQIRIAKDELVGAELAFQKIQREHGIVELDAQAKSAIAQLSDLHAQISAKEVELDALRTYSTERNSSVQLIESELEALRAENQKLEGRHGRAGDGAIDLRGVSDTGPEYLRAEQELRYRQLLLELLIKQVDAARMDEARQATVIQVVEPAIVPERRSSPHRLLITIVFAIGGIVLGCTYAFLVPKKQL